MYKVVRKKGRKLRSCIIYGKHLSIMYKPGKWTKPQVGRILVFKQLRDAQIFAPTLIFPDVKTEIWRCQTKKTRRENFLLSLPPLEDSKMLNAVKEFWELYRHQSYDPATAVARLYAAVAEVRIAPAGTYSASEIKLTKRVR